MKLRNKREWKIGIYRVNGFRQFYALMMAVLPLFTSIAVPFTKTQSISYTLCYIIFPFLACRLIGKTILSKDLIFVYLFFIYYFLRSEGDYIHNFLYSLLVIVNILAIYNGECDMEFLFRTIYTVSIIASFAVMIQTLCYYSIGYHIPMMTSAIVTEGVRDGYDMLFRTGVGGGSYRPSAFFFEPSQMCQYCFIGLSYVLYRWKKNGVELILGLLITFGMILTTSSMGVFLALGVWLWAVFVKGDKILIFRILRILFIGSLIAGLIYLVYRFNLFGMSMMLKRVFGKYNGYNAIEGRTFAANWYLTGLSGKQALLGMGLINKPPDVYMTGLISYRYTIGYIGVILFYLMLIFSIRKMKRLSTVVAVGFGGLFLIMSLGLLSMVFYLGIAYSGFLKEDTSDRINNRYDYGIAKNNMPV